jgi:hypothetical protein
MNLIFIIVLTGECPLWVKVYIRRFYFWKNFSPKLEKGKRVRYYIDKGWGYNQTRHVTTTSNMTLSWDTGGTLRDR